MSEQRFPVGSKPDGRPDGRSANGRPDGRNASDVSDTRYINRDNAVFSATDGGFISLDFDGRHYDRVLIFRSFPFSDAGKFLSVRETVGRNDEIGIIRDINDVDEPTRKLIESELKLRYFVPKIRNIRGVRTEHGFSTFYVITDYGQMKFIIRSSGDSVTRLSDTRIIFTDIDGNRYEVENIEKLSALELKRIDVFL